MSVAPVAQRLPRRVEGHHRADLGRGALIGVVVILVVAIVVSAAIAVTIGSAHLSLPTVLDALAGKVGLGQGVDLLTDHIVWQLRMPRIAGAVAVGAGLAVGGVIVQSLTRNALADPYLLGVSGGAAVGAVLVLVVGVDITVLAAQSGVAAGAFLGAIGALALVLMLASGRVGALLPTRTVLAGIAIGQMCSAITALIVLSGDADAARRVLQWTLGSLAGVRWSDVVIATVALVVVGTLSLSQARVLDAFAFGDRSAASLGVSVTRVRWILYVATALLTATLVAMAGIIGFVGLVIPHAVRLVFGPLHRSLIVVSALVGGLFLLWADTLARTLLGSQEIPIGVLTALVGVPVFAWLLRRNKDQP